MSSELRELPPVAILAGGLGTRLSPLTDHLPKSLVPVCGQPFILHQLRLLYDRGIRRVVLCVGHLGEMIQEAIGDGSQFASDLHVSYSSDGPAPLGTAGAVKKALPLLGDTFFTIYGDSYLDCDFRAVYDHFHRSDYGYGYYCSALMTLYQGIDYGLGVFKAEAFAQLEPGAYCNLDYVYASEDRKDRLTCYFMSEPFQEIGSKQGLEALERVLSNSIRT